MITPDLISDYSSVLQLGETGEQAMLQMHERGLNQLPVLDGKKYVGLLTNEDIIGLKNLNKPLSKFSDRFRKPQVLRTAHIFDVIKEAIDANVRIVPVVDEEQIYLGFVSAESCLRAFSEMSSIKRPGAIVELELQKQEHSLSEISRLVDENNLEILAFYSSYSENSGVVRSTLKLNSNDISSLLAAFERYNYEVKQVHHEDAYSEDLKDRYDALMRYLNV